MKISNNQFKILQSKTVYKSVKLQIDKARISLPNGNIVEWDTNILPSFYYGVYTVPFVKTVIFGESGGFKK